MPRRLIAAVFTLLPLVAHGAPDWRLADAARQGHSHQVQALLDQGVNPNSRDRGNTPALLWATRHAQTATLRQLLGAGADPNLGDRNGVTALMWAAWNGDQTALQLLLEGGADPRLRDHFGFDALWVGAYNSAGDSAFAAALLEAGADPDSRGPEGITALMLAADRGLRELGETLLQGGARVDIVDQRQRNALHHALLQGHAALLPPLLRAADPAVLNRADSIGLTPLLIAVSRSDPVLIDNLLKAGADANGDGPSPLALSVSTGLCRGMASEALLRHGADPDGRNQHGRPALLLAVAQGCQGLVARLLEAGADINAVDNAGNSVLTEAINSGQLRLARLLLRHGAKPDSQPDGTAHPRGRSKGGATPAIIALLQQHRPASTLLLQELLDAGASVDVRDKHGTPALLLATRNGNHPAVRLLAAAVGDIDATDPSGRSALMIATRAGDRALVEQLLRAGANPRLRDQLYAESAIDIARGSGHDALQALLEQTTTPTDRDPSASSIELPLTARAQ